MTIETELQEIDGTPVHAAWLAGTAVSVPCAALSEICGFCGDTEKVGGSCPTCSQQVKATRFGSVPLSVVREGHFRTRRQRGAVAGPRGKFRACAVVDQTKTEYLTACGDVVPSYGSTWVQPPNCAACRRALRRGGK